jgi:hypothetical protein
MAYSRAEWGADPSVDLVPDPAKTKISVHHTVGPNKAWTKAQEREHMRQLEAQHQSQGWSTIGYSIVVFPSGRSYVGRGMALPAAVLNQNTGMYAIAYVGNTELKDASWRARREIRRIIREVLERKPRISVLGGHGEFMATACPGKGLMRFMPKWRKDFGLVRP